jgi:hypothetical protein
MINRLLLLALTLCTVFLAAPSQVLAKDLFNAACQNGQASQESAVCNSNTGKDPLTGSDGALAKITNIIAFIAGALAVIMVIYGSLKYVTSGGDSGNVKSAKDTVFFALIGIVVIVASRTLILFVLGKL